MDFKSPDRISMEHEKFVNSAVFVLIIPYKVKPYDLILIRRTKRENDKHSGEISFPGGKYDPTLDSSYLDTAKRELKEELGIELLNENILGCIDDHLTPKGFIITPFVAFIQQDQQMIKQDAEVKKILKIPITFFINKENYKERTYTLKGDTVSVGKYNYKSPQNGKRYVIFGATSHIIVNFIERVYNIILKTAGCRRINCEDIENKIIK
ncbi:MAG: NUDIX hydrolase [Candidatus Hermodarchaeota archaeon]